MSVFKSIFPYDQSLVDEFELMDDAELDDRINKSEKAYKHWSNLSFAARADVLKKVAQILRKDVDEFADTITHEMGKVLAEAKAEVEKCAVTCEYFAEHGEAFLQDEIVDGGYYKSLIAYQPIGAVLAIMPWNFPFWQVFRYAAPTLMAGNVTFLKHAPNVTGCALAIERVFLEAGAEEGVFQTLIIDTPEVEKIIAADIVQAVTLTGSEGAGSAVASLAGKHIKKQVMELGGSDALIVLPDADMKQAAATAVQSRMQNAGQSCIAAKRFIVLKDALGDFVTEVEAQIKKLRQGNPLQQGITTGPMARFDLAQQLQKQMQASLTKGAVLSIGGEVNGCNYQPTLLLKVREGMPAFDEETFGPMASVISVADEAEAVAVANESRYGLGGSIWTKDIDKGIALARKITTGAVFINTLVKSDARLPFGGIKKSGYGRELGKLGIHEFVNAKTIAVNR
ncbi:NAD-dependent succinate-semialdehyde dehydrogenase [Foetidibacter luteolus]|uniref:NAD-dependent succinate-semialdehyde dehydrogenase n=1 Tax=Foetidibacter luteolus TaxID=2608880 RepID=UPI00129B8625|nr:NAD-dependent succinate-semialdehyde dehydrogenase [Foetidibacter luteolus]